MAGNCSDAALRQCSSQVRCDDYYPGFFSEGMSGLLWKENALLLVNAVLAGVMVGIGSYGQRYRHHPFTRLIFLGATTLFLPIVSYLVSTTNDDHYYAAHITNSSEPGGHALTAFCFSRFHPFVVSICAFLVQITATNTCVIVAGDEREGRNIGPPFELLIQAVWVAYVTRIIDRYTLYSSIIHHDLDMLLEIIGPLLTFVVICGKMVLKYYAFGNARKSFAFGRSPRLVLGYMQQLQLQQGDDPPRPPPLLVMGEETRHVEKQPHGYVFKDGYSSDIGLATIDKIWRLDNVLLMPTPQPLKELCLSFALFKLLRCRFARYGVSSNTGSKTTTNFFWSLLLEEGQHDKVFRVTEDELSFVHDYYYSSLPISYSKCWLPILSIFASLSSIGCILVIIYTGLRELNESYDIVGPNIQIKCYLQCSKGYYSVSLWQEIDFGWEYFDIIPPILLLALVLIAEVRDIASYICSNWTKVTLICRCVISNRTSAHNPITLPKWVSLLLRCRCKLMKHWDGKMNQCSVLGFHRSAPLLVLLTTRLLRLPDQKTKVKVSASVKLKIIDALRSCNSHGRRLSNGTSSLRQSQVRDQSFLWACNGKGTSDIILTWHIATCILEVRYPQLQEQETQSISDNKIVAIHLSRYCAYLMAWYPDLLPDDDGWSKSVYDGIKKDVVRVLASGGGAAAAGSSTPEAKYQKLLAQLMSEPSNHEVLKSGVRIGKQLAELTEGEGGQEAAWKLLAAFWSEMILYVAPSDNLKGHSEAIARGGELITLIWAMLFHAGIVDRPTESGCGIDPAAGVA